jgi:hypothetical protein
MIEADAEAASAGRKRLVRCHWSHAGLSVWRRQDLKYFFYALVTAQLDKTLQYNRAVMKYSFRMPSSHPDWSIWLQTSSITNKDNVIDAHLARYKREGGGRQLILPRRTITCPLLRALIDHGQFCYDCATHLV